MSEDNYHALAKQATNPQLSAPKNGDEVRLSRSTMLAELAMSAPMTGAAVAVEFSKRVGELSW